MEQYSIKQRVKIIQTFYKNFRNVDDTCRDLSAQFSQSEVPSQQSILNLVKQFESVGHVGEAKETIRTGKVKPAKTITNVIDRLAENQAGRANDLDSKSSIPADDPPKEGLKTKNPNPPSKRSRRR